MSEEDTMKRELVILCSMLNGKFRVDERGRFVCEVTNVSGIDLTSFVKKEFIMGKDYIPKEVKYLKRKIIITRELSKEGSSTIEIDVPPTVDNVSVDIRASSFKLDRKRKGVESIDANIETAGNVVELIYDPKNKELIIKGGLNE